MWQKSDLRSERSCSQSYKYLHSPRRILAPRDGPPSKSFNDVLQKLVLQWTVRTVFLRRKPLPSAKSSPFSRHWIHGLLFVHFRREVLQNTSFGRLEEPGRYGEVDDGEPKTSAHKAWQAACSPRRLRAGAPAVRFGCRSVCERPRRASNYNVLDAWQTAGHRV